MVNDLKRLLHDNVASPPDDQHDLVLLVDLGRRRARTRRAYLAAGAVAGIVALALGATVLAARLGGGDPQPTHRSLEPVGPVVGLADAVPAVEGRDYRVVTSWTNRNLDDATGQYLDGITDDGRVVLRDNSLRTSPDAPHGESRVVLLDPAMQHQDSLPPPPRQIGVPVDLGTHRLVYTSASGEIDDLHVLVFDRDRETWSHLTWPRLTDRDPRPVAIGPDGRLYVAIARDVGETRSDLWSASLTDGSDVRNEHTVGGEFAFHGDELTWTTSHNGPNDGVHVRNLTTGEQTDFDPLSGDRCNELAMWRTSTYVVMNQYCGTEDGFSDHRVQVVSTTGEPLVTIRGGDVEGTYATDGGVAIDVNSGQRRDGTYVYRLDPGRLVRLTTSLSAFSLPILTPDGSELVGWSTPVNRDHGVTQWVGRLP